MALQGDDEIESLLALMGSASGQPAAAAVPSTKPDTRTDPPTSKRTIKSDGRPDKEKSKDRRKKRKHKARDRVGKKKSKGGGGPKGASFVDTRLSQNCFEWPRCDGDGRRYLSLGAGLLHDCGGYERDGSSSSYGSEACRRCGKSAAAHELCISSDFGDAAESCDPLSVMSLAAMIVASRNARCIIGEHHPSSTTNHHDHDMPKNGMLPPLNSEPSAPGRASSALDVYVGRILVSVKKMRGEPPMTKPSPRGRGEFPKQFARLCSVASVTGDDMQLLNEKTSSLISAVQDYKKSLAVFDLPKYMNAKKSAVMDLAEKRLAAMAACDSVYYRCYYAAVVSPGATRVDDGPVMAAIVPHPPTYFSCPGLAWDTSAGIEALRIFVGEGDDSLDCAAPLDESTKKILLDSWGLRGRHSADTSENEGNPLLTLWRSRYLETIRHVWCTKYTMVKSPRAIRRASKSVEDENGVLTPNGSPEAMLKLHETVAISSAMEKWRDSMRDYPANFFAYATPTHEALQAISRCLNSSSIEQVLEHGAGTGYWSALLLKHLERTGQKPGGSNPVVAYDIAPPSFDQNVGVSAVANEYHGNIPAFFRVNQADTVSQAVPLASTVANTALLLCYPPPGSDMARKALKSYMSNGGRVVMHVGEWQGLTGDASFEALLTENFSAKEENVVRLPCWGTDATYLTIWRKKADEDGMNTGSAGSGAASCSPALGYCSAKACFNRPTRRCRYVRYLQYCSLECYENDSSQRSALLAVHMLRTTSKDDLDYLDDAHFVDLSSMASLHTSREEGPRKKKMRRKKKR